MIHRLAIAIVLLLAAAARADDRWYVMQIEGRRAGWFHEWSQTDDKTGQITSRTELMLSMRRDQVTVTTQQSSEFVETADGKPLRSVQRTTFGTIASTQIITFSDKGFEVVTQQSGQTVKTMLPAPKQAWLPPAAAGRHVDEQLVKKAEKISFWTLQPSTDLAPIRIDLALKGREDVEVLGKTVPAILWESAMSNLPGVTSRDFVDESGKLVKSTITPAPGMTFTMLLADKDLAQAKVDPPELLASSLIESKEAIEDARNVKQAVFELTFDRAKADGDALKVPGVPGVPDLPKAGYQRVVWGDDRTARVIVDLSQPVAPGTDLPRAEHRRATPALNSDDPKVKALAAEAIKGLPADAPTRDKAEAMRKFVRGYVRTKDLSVGLATASEVARTRQGDCTEHAVLLAAMLRCAGIPSRTVSGLIYADEFVGKKQIFAYHMWTQAWLDSASPKESKATDAAGACWVDLDATLDVPFDAAHIALAASAMDEAGSGNDMVKLVPIMGRLRVKVIKVK